MLLSVKNLPPTTIEAFGPFSSCHFSAGLSLTIATENAKLRGGPQLEKTYSLKKISANIPNSQTNYSQLIDTIEENVGVRLIATSPTPSHKDVPSVTSLIETTFRVGDYCIKANWLGEALLDKFQVLESQCRDLVLKQVDEDSLNEAVEIVAATKDLVRDGRLGPSELDDLVHDMKAMGLPIEEAFFLSNEKSIADGARGTILRACYHFSKMTEHIYKINQQRIDYYHPGQGNQAPCEIIHSGEATDIISNEFASTVIACYSSLDLLYDWFVYLTREPFGQPQLPRDLHFPDNDPSKGLVKGGQLYPYDLSAQEAAYAIPNLPANTFFGLRRVRNDLVHNIAPDELRSHVRIGIGLPPVNNELLQYCQYISRDGDTLQSPRNHPLMRHFYKDQTDAQLYLYSWLIMTWQTYFDTTEWITNRVLKM